jgi:hypothetical protein
LQRSSRSCRKLRLNLRALWNDADPEIPIPKEAKAEYAKLQEFTVGGKSSFRAAHHSSNYPRK